VNRRAEWTKRALKEATRLDAITRQRVFAAIKRGFVRKTRAMCAASKEWARFTGFGSVTGE
jgi:hypothetical protein